MEFQYYAFDRLHSMISLSKTRANGRVVLKGQSNDPEMKIMFISSDSGTSVDLKSVFDDLTINALSAEGRLVADSWVLFRPGLKFYFQSIQNTRCDVKSQLCRYTAFSYILKNGKVEIYDCDNESVTHRAYVDITMPVYYSIKPKLIQRRRFLRAAEMVDSGYCEVSFDCEDMDLYQDGYIEYLCGEISIPVTSDMLQNGFFVQVSKNEPELYTRRRELVDLKRR